jgi:RNA polymerase sigma factor (TIGR02999 family)
MAAADFDPTPERKMGEITVLLRQWHEGNRTVENQLFRLVLPDLKKLARNRLREVRQGFPLQATELVDEAYCKLIKIRHFDWRSRAVFFALAGRVMRHYLIDELRKEGKAKLEPISKFNEFLRAKSLDLDQILTMSSLMDELAASEPELCAAVEMKYVLGLTDEEAAEALEIPKRTFQRRWLEGRRWLFERAKHAAASAKR